MLDTATALLDRFDGDPSDEDELLAAAWSDPEAEKVIAHALDDEPCLKFFLRDAARSGERVEALCAEILEESNHLPRARRGRIKRAVRQAP